MSTILVLVAHKPTGQLIESCLRKEGYTSVQVTSCADAIRVLVLIRIDLLILWRAEVAAFGLLDQARVVQRSPPV